MQLLSFESSAVLAMRDAATNADTSTATPLTPRSRAPASASASMSALSAALDAVERQWVAVRRVFVGQVRGAAAALGVGDGGGAQTGALPSLAARRSDLEYQRVRLRLFKRLLQLHALNAVSWRGAICDDTVHRHVYANCWYSTHVLTYRCGSRRVAAHLTLSPRSRSCAATCGRRCSTSTLTQRAHDTTRSTPTTTLCAGLRTIRCVLARCGCDCACVR
jgi:hypothetical protein